MNGAGRHIQRFCCEILNDPPSDLCCSVGFSLIRRRTAGL